MAYGESNDHLTDAVTWPEWWRVFLYCGETRDFYTLRAQYLENSWTW